MPIPSQGEIWWANLPQPAGRRPVLILTRSDAIPHLLNVTVAPLTRTMRGLRTEVALSTADGVPTESAISLDNVLTIRQALLDRPIAALGVERLAEVFAAIRYVFDMPSEAHRGRKG